MTRIAILLATILSPALASAQVTTSTSYTVTLTIAPQISSVALSNTSLSATGTIAAGSIVGAVSVVPPDAPLTSLTIGGPAAAKFRLDGCAVVSNRLTAPCNLVLAVPVSASETDQITLNASQP